MELTVVVGDVHGCREELEELLEGVEYDARNDRLIFAGDLIDRGPYPRQVVEFARQIGAECVMGNHEDKAIRWKLGRPVKVKPDREQEWRSFSPSDWEYLMALPPHIKLNDNLYVVHGGCRPGRSVERQFYKEAIRLRYMKKSNLQMASVHDVTEENKDQYVWWTDIWDGPHVIYGHAVWMDYPRRDKTATGIDTGCVFGGALTAALIWDGEIQSFWSVPARKKYSTLEINE